jgi:hypothetical protein
VILRYQSGEEIKKGDRVLFHQNPAEVEFVASNPDDPETDWYVQEYGGGVMIFDPMVSGHTFLPADSIGEYEDLEFVSRAKEA